MKFNFVRAGVASALLLALAACGGTEEFTVSGTIAGLRNNGLVLSNNGETVMPAAHATSFSFPTAIEYGNTYKVTALTQPPHQTCTVYRGTGTAGQMANMNIFVDCIQNAYTVGGTVSGLTADGLVLVNGSASSATLPKNTTSFSFPNKVEDGATYGITVLTNPTGLRCTVANGVGTMGQANVTNVAVTCVPAT
jgi:hypothetical protein